MGARGTPAVDDEQLFEAVRRACEEHDPVRPGFVDDLVALVGRRAPAAVDDVDDLDYELLVLLVLLVLVEQSRALRGTRGDPLSYMLRFARDDLELLVRASVADDQGRARLDGWIVPPSSGSAELRRLDGSGRPCRAAVDDSGRLEFPDLAPGLYRLSLDLDDTRTFQTPGFEI